MAQASEQDDRRGAYRVQPESPDELDLALLGQRQRLVRAVIDDVAVGGARIRLDQALARELELAAGKQVTLDMNSQRYDYRGQMPARVVSTTAHAGEQVLHLAFQGNHAEFIMHGNDVFALFNRRTRERGTPAADSFEFDARVSPNTSGDQALRSYVVGVRNLSNVGVSLLVPAATHTYLCDQRELTMTLRLPGKDDVCRIACNVRHHYADGDNYIYGCEYDWSATTDPLAVVEDLVAFMLDDDAS
jgi:hypothetical protein